MMKNWQRVKVCPLCAVESFKSYSKYRRWFLLVRLERCSNCGLVIQNPRLTDESLDKFYHKEYRHRLKKRMDLKHCENMFERGIRRGDYICRFFEENGIEYRGSVVFEAGCAYGGILKEFQRRGCRVEGCDIDKTPVDYGISKGLGLVVGPVDVLLNSGDKADIIILSHLLEHIAEPVHFLDKVRQTLKPKGVVYIEIPGINNPKSKKNRYAQISHLIYFNLDTTRKMAERAGFEFISGNEVVQGLFRMV